MPNVEQRLRLHNQDGAGLPRLGSLRGFRSAIHISPRSGIDVPVDGVEFSVDAHALLSDSTRGGPKSVRA